MPQTADFLYNTNAALAGLFVSLVSNKDGVTKFAATVASNGSGQWVINPKPPAGTYTQYTGASQGVLTTLVDPDYVVDPFDDNQNATIPGTLMAGGLFAGLNSSRPPGSLVAFTTDGTNAFLEASGGMYLRPAALTNAHALVFIGAAWQTLSATGLTQNTLDDGTGKMTLANTLTVNAGATITGGVTVGGLAVNNLLTVVAGGALITGASKVTGTFEVTAGLQIDAGGMAISAGGMTVTNAGGAAATLIGNVGTSGTVTIQDTGGVFASLSMFLDSAHRKVWRVGTLNLLEILNAGLTAVVWTLNDSGDATSTRSTFVAGDAGAGIAAQLGLTNVRGLGTGAQTAVTAPLLGAGSGPATPTQVIDWLKVYRPGTGAVGWIPVMA